MTPKRYDEAYRKLAEMGKAAHSYGIQFKKYFIKEDGRELLRISQDLLTRRLFKASERWEGLDTDVRDEAPQYVSDLFEDLYQHFEDVREARER